MRVHSWDISTKVAPSRPTKVYKNLLVNCSNLSSAALEYLKSFYLMVYRCAVTLLFIHCVDCGWGDVVFGSNRMY